MPSVFEKVASAGVARGITAGELRAALGAGEHVIRRCLVALVLGRRVREAPRYRPGLRGHQPTVYLPA